MKLLHTILCITLISANAKAMQEATLREQMTALLQDQKTIIDFLRSLDTRVALLENQLQKTDDRLNSIAFHMRSIDGLTRQAAARAHDLARTETPMPPTIGTKRTIVLVGFKAPESPAKKLDA